MQNENSITHRKNLEAGLTVQWVRTSAQDSPDKTRDVVCYSDESRWLFDNASAEKLTLLGAVSDGLNTCEILETSQPTRVESNRSATAKRGWAHFRTATKPKLNQCSQAHRPAAQRRTDDKPMSQETTKTSEQPAPAGLHRKPDKLNVPLLKPMKTTTESPATKPAKPRLNKVLELLSATHPGLPVETDRDWLWVTQKLDQSVPIEAAVIKWLESIGFIYAKRRGGHPMPSGKTGYYGHNCTHYVPFKRHGTAARSSSGASGGIHTSVTTNPPMPTEELAAFLNS